MGFVKRDLLYTCLWLLFVCSTLLQTMKLEDSVLTYLHMRFYRIYLQLCIISTVYLEHSDFNAT